MGKMGLIYKIFRIVNKRGFDILQIRQILILIINYRKFNNI